MRTLGHRSTRESGGCGVLHGLGSRNDSMVVNVTVADRFGRLTRPQVGVLGAIVGYSLGIVAGPVVRLLVGISLIVVFYFVGKHLDDRFEAALGLAGVMAAILATYLLEPVRHALAGTLGDLIGHASRLILAAIGVFVALQLYDRDDADSEEFDSD